MSLVLKLIRFSPLLVVVLLLNYFVDPSQLFANGRIEHEVAGYLLEGNNVGNLINFDHRLLQEYYFEKMEAKDVIVLGSSRAMLIRESQFPGESFYNASIAGPSIEDYIALFSMLDKAAFPKTIYLEISPWVFNENHGQTRWKTIASDYFAGLSLLDLENSRNQAFASFDFEKYVELFSIPYFQESLKWLTRGPAYYSTTETNTGDVMKLHDGSRVYSSMEENRTLSEVSTLVSEALQSPYSLGNFHQISPAITAQFEKLLAGFGDRNIDVVILMVPYHPRYYAALIDSADFRIISDVEEYLNGIADGFNLRVVGSYDPRVVGCLQGEFYDSMHPKEECINKVMDLASLGT